MHQLLLLVTQFDLIVTQFNEGRAIAPQETG